MFKNIWLWIKNALGNIAKALENPAKIAVEVVNVIKQWVFNPLVDVVTALTNSSVDNDIVSLLKQYLPDALTILLKGENIIKDVKSGDLSSLINIFASYIKGISESSRGKWWADLAAIILQIISSVKLNKNVPQPVAFAMTQGVYLKSI